MNSTVFNNVGIYGRAQKGNSPDLRKTGIHPDFWYPVARSKKLKTGKTLAVSFAGEPIVLVRTTSNDIYALEDRCAHRQVPLSAGVVNGDKLQCGYHCWTYDSTGKCVTVPYLDKEKTLPNGLHSYPCQEAYGMVFVFPGNTDKASSTAFPDISSATDSHYKTRYLDRRVNAHYSFMHENLMDMNHQFLHRRLMGRIRTTLMGLRKGDDWIEVDYTFSRTGGKQPWGEKFILRRSSQPKPDKGRDLMTIRTDYPYQTLKFWTAGSDQPALDLWNVYIPVDKEQRINHTFGMMLFRKPSIPGLMNLLWPIIIWFTEGIFAEDRWIVEEEQKAFDSQGADWNQEIFSIIQGLRDVLISQGIALPEHP